ncbi:NAD-dependent epimerase/dehydratase family protein [Ponticaulis sp.]|uniref:NAD-dependent epimerase/dehydratase family protein n=1 Tax=Ponticaulis sp. TaxID=2020902 RepID=UPI00261F2205|nr:NAD-dependent epimerase/dehydratase family protein [Ponticaulis sp.]MDF1679049.1 NAD-dependent epimerase/dehydratase family protein [Ponticaulis sp.]
MSVLVTGAGGFMGASLVSYLVGQGHKVVALDRSLDMCPKGDQVIPVEGDLTQDATISEAFAHNVSAIVHLAALPGGAAETDPELSFSVNVEGAWKLLRRAARIKPGIRFVYASTIAVFGEPLPTDGLTDSTPVNPRMIYGMHKAMVEIAVSSMSRRGELDAVSLRLPGIVARPTGASGLKSAFMSDIFHALQRHETIELPVSQDAQMWMMTVANAVDCLVSAVSLDGVVLPEDRIVTLPALRVRMGNLVAEIARQTGADTSLVTYAPDAMLEAAFGNYPMLLTPAADAAGFRHDGDLVRLVNRALAPC